MKKIKMLKSFLIATPLVAVPLFANSCSSKDNGNNPKPSKENIFDFFNKQFNNYNISVKSGNPTAAGDITVGKIADFSEFPKNFDPTSGQIPDFNPTSASFLKWLNDNATKTTVGANENYSFTLDNDPQTLSLPYYAALLVANKYAEAGDYQKAYSFMFVMPNFNITVDKDDNIVGTPSFSFNNDSVLISILSSLLSSSDTAVNALTEDDNDMIDPSKNSAFFTKIINALGPSKFRSSSINGSVDFGKGTDILSGLSQEYTLNLNATFTNSSLTLTFGGASNNSIVVKS